MALTQQQARALANFVTLLRPGWNADGIYSALGRCKDADPFAVALAAIRAAWDEGAKTPGVIPNQAGPHWREMAAAAPKPKPVTYNMPCPDHPDEAMPCRQCKAATRPPTSDHLERMRAELQSARSNLCSHGVPPDRCSDHRAELAAARDRATADQTTTEETP